MQKDLYTEDHEAFRDTARGFIERYVAPHHAEWEKAGIVDRGVWLEAGKHGLLGFELPEEYGGGGVADFRYNAVLLEEIIRAHASGIGFGLHNDVVAPYLVRLATDEQQARWFAGFCSGELITRDRDERAGGRLGPAGHQDARRCVTATTGCSTARRPSSPTASTPTS